MTQKEFAEKLNISTNYVTMIECKRRTASDKLINEMCRKFSINKKWLLTGEGEMYSLEEESLVSYVSEITDGNDEFIKDLILSYMELDESSKKVLKMLAQNMFEKQKNREQK